jgi:hypothetical protein
MILSNTIGLLILLHVGNSYNLLSVKDRPSPDLAAELRNRYRKISETKRKAAKALSSNPEIATEVSLKK